MPRTFSQQLVGTSGFPQRCSFAGAEGPTIIRVTGGFGFNPTIDGENFPGLDEDQVIAEARARHARFVTIHSDRAAMAKEKARLIITVGRQMRLPGLYVVFRLAASAVVILVEHTAVAGFRLNGGVAALA